MLNGLVYDSAEVFRKMDIKEPVHRFNSPLHPGMMEKLQSGKARECKIKCVRSRKDDLRTLIFWKNTVL